MALNKSSLSNSYLYNSIHAKVDFKRSNITNHINQWNSSNKRKTLICINQMDNRTYDRKMNTGKI